MKNPFDFLSKIKDPKSFFGRKEILYKLYRMLNSLGNCSVVGPRRIGKSSLLYHMALPDTYSSSSHLDEAETYVFAFIDLEVIAMLGVDDFLMMAVKRLCQESSGRLQNPPEEYGTVRGFPSFLEEACAKNLKLVLCCDEFESLDPQKGFECDNGFFSFLRAMSDGYGLTMVTSSRIPLHELCLEGNLPTSPLWNVFDNFPLGLMTEDEMLSLIKEPFARSGISLTKDETSFISDLAGPHPFFLQMACYYLFESKVTQSFPDLSEVKEEFLDKAVKHYDSTWVKLGNRQKEGLRCLVVDGILPEKTVLDRLKDNAIVTSQNQISSSGWEQFIKKKLTEQWPGNHLAIPNIPGTLTWLHISDAHLRPQENYSANVVIQKLLKDIRKCIQEYDLKLDFIAFTGDAAFSGKSKEYDMVRTFLDNLLAATGLSRERLFIVPGNHDVDRELISTGARIIGGSLSDRNSTNAILTTPCDRQMVFRRFGGYAAFVNGYFRGHVHFDDEHFFYVRTLELAGRHVALLGINTAWLCTSDQDKANGLLIGEYQARTALEQTEGADLKVALIHHRLDYLKEFDQDDSASLILDNCNFVLHGHLHQAAINQLSSPENRSMIIACGACYETREYPNKYNFVCIDLSRNSGVIYLRRHYDERGGFWGRDPSTYRNAPDGKYKFVLPSI